jgi:putative DNA primase/helicase
MWRRLRLIPWTVQIPEAEQDGRLGERLQLSADAVLRWLVGGYEDWRDHGLADPAEVITATEGWRGESDALARFTGQRCLTGRHHCVQSSALFAAWCEWCRAENAEAGTQTAFSTELARRGYAMRHTRIGNVWDGIALQGDEEDRRAGR